MTTGCPFEMCDISKGLTNASQSQPANLYAYWALKYATDAASNVALKAGQPGRRCASPADRQLPG